MARAQLRRQPVDIDLPVPILRDESERVLDQPCALGKLRRPVLVELQKEPQYFHRYSSLDLIPKRRIIPSNFEQPIEAPYQFAMHANVQHRRFGCEKFIRAPLIGEIAVEQHPALGPARFGIRMIVVPYAGEEQHDVACADRFPPRIFRGERASPVGEIHYGVIAQSPPLLPLGVRDRFGLLVNLMRRLDAQAGADDMKPPGIFARGGDVIKTLTNGRFIHAFGQFVHFKSIRVNGGMTLGG